ncbi:MAG: aldo/keto reductase [Acidobacteriota bacterium]
MTGTELPKLGLGTVAFGRDWGLKYRRPVSVPSDRELDHLLGVAAELGVTLLDTAPAYGTSEERLGRLLQGRPHRNRPERFWISTKVGETSTPEGASFDFRPRAIRESVERSLRRLKVERLDLVFLHAGADDREAFGGVETLRSLQDEGKIRWIGASTKTVDGALAARNLCDALMLTYNLHDRSQEAVLDQARDTIVLIKKPLASGHASSPAEALRFAAAHPAVDCVIVGTTSADHLRANARALA